MHLNSNSAAKPAKGAAGAPNASHFYRVHSAFTYPAGGTLRDRGACATLAQHLRNTCVRTSRLVYVEYIHQYFLCVTVVLRLVSGVPKGHMRLWYQLAPAAGCVFAPTARVRSRWGNFAFWRWGREDSWREAWETSS